MKRKTIITALVLLISMPIFAYGPIGHRAIAKIAENYLSCRAKRKIKKLLGDENLVLVSTFSDDVKSDRKYDFAYTWHYVNIEEGESYAESKKNLQGDLITAYKHCVKTLKDKKASVEDKRFCLKYLVHLIGDAHQPLHVGHAGDRGGNDIKVKWFYHKSNLHRVWDEEMLDSYKMSYSELAENMPKIPRKLRKNWQKGDMQTWIAEMRPLTNKVYHSAKDGDRLGFNYMYDYMEILRTELNKAGVRLAGVLNNIF